jgi:hypothetical protein
LAQQFFAQVNSRFLPNRAGDCSLLDLDSGLPVEKENKRRHRSVSTEDGFTLNHPLPLVLSDHEGEYDHEVEYRERGLLLLLNATILTITAILMGIAFTLSMGNPIKVFGDAKASLADDSALQPHSVPGTPTIRSTVGAHALPPTTAAPRDETATASDTADQNQRNISEPPSDALLKQFQAWAVKQDVPTQIERAQPMQNARAQDLQQAPVPPVQEHQKGRSVRNARAEIRRLHHARVRRDQNARTEVRPVPDVRAQDQYR